MAFLLKKCKGLWVTSLNQGKIIGHITGSVIDRKKNQLVGFKVKPKKSDTLINELWLPVENIKKIGVDMILVSSDTKLMPEALTGFQVDRLVNMPVTSKDGRALGNLVDVSIDEKNWSIVELELESKKAVVVDIAEMVLGDDMVLIHAHPELNSIRPERKSEKKISVEKSQDSTKDKIFKQGEKFVERTTRAVQKVLQGSEANLAKVRNRIAEHDPKRIADLSKKRKSSK